MKQTKKQFNFLTTLLAASFIVVVVVFFMSFKRLAMQAKPESTQSIKTVSELEQANMELDDTNVDEMDDDLEKIGTDSASF